MNIVSRITLSLVACLLGCSAPDRTDNEGESLDWRSVRDEAKAIAVRVRQTGEYDAAAQSFVREHTLDQPIQIRVRTWRVLTAAWESDLSSRDGVEKTFLWLCKSSQSSLETIPHWLRLNNLRGFGHTLQTRPELEQLTPDEDKEAWLRKAFHVMETTSHAKRMGYVTDLLSKVGNSKQAREKLAHFLTTTTFPDEPFSGYWKEFSETCLRNDFPSDEGGGVSNE